MKIEERGLVYDATRQLPAARVASFTGLLVTKAGTAFCSFQCGSKKHALDSTVRIFRSTDHGRTWSDTGNRFETSFQGVAGSLSSGEMEEVSPGRLMVITTWFDRSEPARPIFDPVTEGILRTKQLVAFSEDEGKSWTPWREIPIAGLKGCASTGPLLRWTDSTIAYPFESYKEYDDPQPGRHGAWFIATKDGGRTFGAPVLVAQDPQGDVYYWDQRMSVGKTPGEYISLFWTHDLRQKKDLAVHVKHHRPGVAGGDVPRTTGLPGQISAPLLLDDGRLLAGVIAREKPGTVTLCQSDDDGKTWPHRLVIYTHDEKALLTQGAENIDFVQYWEDMGKWSFGHPAIRLVGKNKLLIVHYAGVPNCLSVHWIRVDLTR